MEKQMELLPGVTLTAVQTEKFKTGCFSINFFRPLRREEAAMNALIPSVLLRGSEGCPDLRAIAARLDELYGASAGTLIRKKGEVQMTGFYADFIEDALAGESVFAPMMAAPAPAGERGVFGGVCGEREAEPCQRDRVARERQADVCDGAARENDVRGRGLCRAAAR